mgnify:CR=1 FL=1
MVMLSYDVLPIAKVKEALADLPGWEIHENGLRKTFENSSYPLGALFVSTIALHAELLNHHPDVKFTYKTVEVWTTTHDSGGITSYDLELARRISSPSPSGHPQG